MRSVVVVAASAALVVVASRRASAQSDGETAVPAETSTQADPQGRGRTLEELIEQALLKNPQVEVERARIEEAQALYTLAAAQAYPVLNMTVLFGGPTPEAQTEVVNDPSTVTEPSLAGDFDFGELGVTLRLDANAFVPIYTFGKISNAKEAASHAVEAQEEQTHATAAEVALNVARAFWTVQLTRAAARSLADGTRTLEKVLEKVEELLEAESPQVTENDRLRLLHALGTLKVRRIEVTYARRIAKKALLLLIGRDQSTDVEVAETELDAGVPEEIPPVEEMIESARRQRPELLALRQVVAAQEAFVELRKAQFYPDIFLGALVNGAYTSNATDQTNPFINDPFNFFTVGIGIGMRLQFDFFNKLALLEQAEAQARVRLAQQNLATEAAELDVRRIHNTLEGSMASIEQLERNVRTARSWLTATVLAYDIGLGQAEEMTEAFQAWAASEAALHRTRFDTILQMTELARATGRLVSP